MKINALLLVLLSWVSLGLAIKKHKAFLRLQKDKEEKLALNDFRFRLVVAFFNEVSLDVAGLEAVSDPLLTVRNHINKNKGYICVLSNKVYNLDRFLQMASRLVVNDHSEYFEDINEAALKKVQSNYGQFQKHFQELVQQGVNTNCHINVDDIVQRFDPDQKETVKQMKKHQLDLMLGLLELYKDTVDNQLPPEDSHKLIDSPKIIETVKEQKVLWMKRSLDDSVFTTLAEQVNDVFQSLANQVEDEKGHEQWDNHLSELFVSFCEYYYVFSLEHCHLVTMKKQALLFLQKFKLTLAQTLQFIEREINDPQKTKKMKQFSLYATSVMLAGTQVPFWTQLFANNLHPVDQMETDDLADQQNHMNLFYKGQQMLVEYHEPIAYLKEIFDLMQDSHFKEKKELKLIDYANGLKDFESFCEISIYFCNNVLFKNPQLLLVFQELKPTFLQKLVKQLEQAPITDIQHSGEEHVEKYLLSYGYKKVNRQIGSGYLYYCRGCAGPYFMTQVELKTGSMAELLAEVNVEGSKNIIMFQRITDDLVLYQEKTLKTHYDPKKMEVLAEILSDDPGLDTWTEIDKAIDTTKGVYLFFQRYNSAKQFYEGDLSVLKDQYAHIHDFQEEQVVLFVEGPRECQLKVLQEEKGIRKVDQFNELEMYLLRGRKGESGLDENWKDSESLNTRFRDTHGCINVMVVELQDTRFGQVNLVSKKQKEDLAKDNKADLLFFKVPEQEDFYLMLKIFIDYQPAKKSKKEYTIQDLKKSVEKLSKPGVTAGSGEALCKSVKEKGTPFLDDDPDEYLKHYVGKEAAFPKEEEQLNYAKQVQDNPEFDCEKQLKKMPVMKEHHWEETELLFGHLLQGKIEGLLGELLKEAAVNHCMLAKVYEVSSACKENILYLTKIDGSQIIEEVCVGPTTSPQKLLAMPKDDLVPIEKKYYLTIAMQPPEYPEDQYSFNRQFGGYIPAAWLEMQPAIITDPELKKKIKVYLNLWIKTDPYAHNYVGFSDEYSNYDKCLKTNNNFLKEEQIKDPTENPLMYNIRSAVAASASPIMLAQVIDQIGIGMPLEDKSKLKKLLKNNQCKFTKVYLPIYYKGQPGSSCDIIDPQFLVKSIFFSADSGVEEICDGMNFAVADVYYLELIIYEDAVGDDQALELLIAKRQGYVPIQKHRKYSLAANGYSIELRVWAKPNLQNLQLKSLICV